MERIYLNNHTFGENYRGVFIVRGENVVFLGELDPDREDFIDDQAVDSSVEDADTKPREASAGLGTIIPQNASPQVLRRIPFADAERIFKERATLAKKVFKERSKKMSPAEIKDQYENQLY